MTILVQKMVYKVCKKGKYTLFWVYASSRWWDSLLVGLTSCENGEIYTQIGYIFSFRDLFLCVGPILLKLHKERKAIHWLPRTSRKNRKIGRLMQRQSLSLVTSYRTNAYSTKTYSSFGLSSCYPTFLSIKNKNKSCFAFFFFFLNKLLCLKLSFTTKNQFLIGKLSKVKFHVLEI